jgi:hypothetical protein
MRRQAIIGALVLIGLGVVLGGTVLRDQVASARSLAQSVVVSNTSAQAVPVREQNLDTNNDVKVHEQGTADVNVTNSSLTVAPQDPVTDGGFAQIMNGGDTADFVPSTVSALSIHLSSAATGFTLSRGSGTVAVFLGPADEGNSQIELAFNRPITFDRAFCGGVGAECSISAVGNTP